MKKKFVNLNLALISNLILYFTDCVDAINETCSNGNSEQELIYMY